MFRVHHFSTSPSLEVWFCPASPLSGPSQRCIFCFSKPLMPCHHIGSAPKTKALGQRRLHVCLASMPSKQAIDALSSYWFCSQLALGQRCQHACLVSVPTYRYTCRSIRRESWSCPCSSLPLQVTFCPERPQSQMLYCALMPVD